MYDSPIFIVYPNIPTSSTAERIILLIRIFVMYIELVLIRDKIAENSITMVKTRGFSSLATGEGITGLTRLVSTILILLKLIIHPVKPNDL